MSGITSTLIGSVRFLSMTTIYFDNNATTRMTDEVVATLTSAASSGYANPASQHEMGRIARQKLESCREQIGQLLHLPTGGRCIFTSGGTEANNLALMGHFPSPGKLEESNVVCSSIEHPSIIDTLAALKKSGLEIRWVDPDASGSVDPKMFDSAIDSNTRLACCMLANHETGVIQPVSEIASVCRRRKVPFHVDAVQAIGKIPFDFAAVGCSSATFSAHKIHGPPGIAALFVSEGIQLTPRQFGGFQQEGIRPGTESLPLIAAFAKSVELAVLELAAHRQHLLNLRDHFEEVLCSRLENTVINAQDSDRLPGTSNISFLGMDRQQFVMAADLSGLCCSTGSACSSGSSTESHVLKAMNCGKPVLHSAVRFGFSRLNRLSEIDLAIERICRIFSTFRESK